MKKKQRYAGNIPIEVLGGLFYQWTNNLAGLASQYPDDTRFDMFGGQLTSAFDAIIEKWEMPGDLLLCLIWQPAMLPITDGDEIAAIE